MSVTPRVLITNDDGPPGPESPYVFGLFMELKQTLGWDVRVVLPRSQKSWIGKAYQIKDTIHGCYYYPRLPDGLGESSEVSRPLKEGEVAEWILLEGTPATCTNIALYNLYPGDIDLVVSGPNLGRNTSSAFALSSGTIGAALSAALSLKRAIALSYGTFLHPTPVNLHAPAHKLSGRIIKRLWEDWGKDEDSTAEESNAQNRGLRKNEVDLYNVNIPLVEKLLDKDGLGVVWTRIWRNSYGRLFNPKAQANANDGTSPGGPLTFTFAPRFSALVSPPLSSLPYGTDAWAVHHDLVSVTPLRANFAEPGSASLGWGNEWGDLKDVEEKPGRQCVL